eukprot:Clim_evm63s11 gene=Clim_evmTU63s11
MSADRDGLNARDQATSIAEYERGIAAQDRRRTDVEKQREQYVNVSKQIRSLQQSYRKKAMVPLGDLAYMPGYIEHTGEIMVLLGENQFAMKTAKQARDLADRRKEWMDSLLVDIDREITLLQQRLDYIKRGLDPATVPQPMPKQTKQQTKANNLKTYSTEQWDSEGQSSSGAVPQPGQKRGYARRLPTETIADGVEDMSGQPAEDEQMVAGDFYDITEELSTAELAEATAPRRGLTDAEMVQFGRPVDYDDFITSMQSTGKDNTTGSLWKAKNQQPSQITALSAADDMSTIGPGHIGRVAISPHSSPRTEDVKAREQQDSTQRSILKKSSAYGDRSGAGSSQSVGIAGATTIQSPQKRQATISSGSGAFTERVVERSPTAAVSGTESEPQRFEPPQRVSKFKQQMLAKRGGA